MVSTVFVDNDITKPVVATWLNDINNHAYNVNGNPHNTTKSHVGLSAVDNTPDLSKPISTATQTALNLKVNLTDISGGAANVSFATLKLAAGTVSLPSLYLSTDTTTGLYRIGANNDGYAVSGTKILDISSTGLTVVGNLISQYFNGNVLTTGSGTLTLGIGKTTTFNSTNTFAGTDGQIYTFPTTSATLARIDAANTFTGIQTFTSTIAGTITNGEVTTNKNIANGYVGKNADSNATVNNFVQGYATTATTGGTTVLSASSPQQQYFTGTQSQTITMPVVSVLATGHTFTIDNNSTGTLIVNSSGGNLITIIAMGMIADFTCISTSGTTASSWSKDTYWTTSSLFALTVSDNTFMGLSAGYSNTTGYSNTFSGVSSGYRNTTGYNNTFSGLNSGYLNTTGYNNTFSGLNSGYSNTTGNYNTFIGSQTGYSNTTGSQNTFNGMSAGYLNTTGYNNTFSGLNSGYSNTTGYLNTFNGSNSGYSNTTGYYNTFIGYGAGYYNTTGSNNTFHGMNAGYTNTTGSNNTFNGMSAGYLNTTGYYNTFIGYGAGYSNTTGYNNTFNGLNSGYSNTTGYYNTFIGYGAGYSNTIGYQNMFDGMNAGYSNTTGNYNTFIGQNTGSSNITGYNNTFSGQDAGSNNTSGYYNTFVGSATGQSNTTFFNCSAFGYNAQVGGSNQLRLGDTSTTVYTQSGTVSASDIRDKTDIRDTVLGLEFICKLRPVDYKWDIRLDYATSAPVVPGESATNEDKTAYIIARDEWLIANKPANLIHDGTHKRNRYHHGLIAQELGSLLTSTKTDFGGYQNFEVNGGEALQAVVYEELIGPIIKAIQELKAENIELRNTLKQAGIL